MAEIIRKTVKKLTPTEKLRPLPHQELMLDIHLRNLRTNPGVLDFSPTGAGKTYMALLIARALDLRIILVTKKKVREMWRKESKKYGINIDIIREKSLKDLFYNRGSLESDDQYIVEGINTSEGNLYFDYRKIGYESDLADMPEGINLQGYYGGGDAILQEFQRGYIKEREIEVLGDYFKKIVHDGILFVLDESQTGKNFGDSAISIRLAKIQRYISLHGGISRFIDLSATPIDKEYHSNFYLYSYGIIPIPLSNNDKMIEKGEYGPISQKINNVYACKWAELYAPKYYLKLAAKFKDHGIYLELEPEYSEIAYEIFRNILVPTISGRMLTQNQPEVIQEVYNARVHIYSRKKYMEQLEKLKAILDNDKNSDLEKNPNITQILSNLEEIKIPDIVRLVQKRLSEHKYEKVIIGASYGVGISALACSLRHYNPLILTGKTDDKESERVIQEFNNDTQHRLLILNILSGSTGINLDSRSRKWKRFTVILPGHRSIETIQTIGRTYRAKTLGNSLVYVFYGNSEGLELSGKKGSVRASEIEKGIFYNLEKKSRIVESTLKKCISPDDRLGKKSLTTLSNLPSVYINIYGDETIKNDGMESTEDIKFDVKMPPKY